MGGLGFRQGSVVLLLLFLAAIGAVTVAPGASADCHNIGMTCPENCPLVPNPPANARGSGPGTGCRHPTDGLVAVAGGLQFYAILDGGRLSDTAIRTGDGVSFTAGQFGYVQFFVTDADSDSMTNLTVLVNITMEAHPAGSATWTRGRFFETRYESGSVPGTHPSREIEPEFEFQISPTATTADTELRFILRVQEPKDPWRPHDPSEPEGEGMNPEQHVQMGFMVDLQSRLNAPAPAGLTPLLITALALMASCKRRRR